jgi:ABC-2 type transport system permease protein
MLVLGGGIMQVFNTYFKILKRQMVSLVLYGVMFLCLTIMITTNIKLENNQFKASKVKILIDNDDKQSDLIDGFLNYLGQYAIFVDVKDDPDARKDALFSRRVSYILTIPEGFTDKFLMDGFIDLKKETAPDSIEAISIDNAINSYLNMAKVYLKHVPEIDYVELNTYVGKNLGEETQVLMEIKTEDEVAFSNGFNRNYYNYLGYILIITFITSVSIIMFSFHGIDIRRRQSASPLTNHSMNAQLLFANLIFVFTYIVLFVVAGILLNRTHIVNVNTIMTWLNVCVFALTALSISYLVGISIKSRKVVSPISTALSLSMAFLSGIFVPQEYLGAPVLKVASFMPTFWYVKANNAIETIGSFHWNEISEIVGYMAIQLGFAAAIISVSLVVSKRKRQQAF